MTAKQELFDFLKGKPTVKCASVSGGFDENGEGDGVKEFHLKVGHDALDFLSFFDNFNYNYYEDDNYAEPFGTFWFDDGSYAIKEDYGGLTMWIHRTVPKIPEFLYK